MRPLERPVSHRRCNAERFDCYSCVQPQEEVPRYIRGDFSGFRALGVRKVDALLPILRRGVHVVLSDVDCVWLHDPNPMVRGLVPGYEDFAHADLIVSTDCHNPKSDYDSDGCFGDLLDKNTGVMAIRATPNGISISPHISLYLPISPYTSLYLPMSPCISRLPVSPCISKYLAGQASRAWPSGACDWRWASRTSRTRPPSWI